MLLTFEQNKTYCDQDGSRNMVFLNEGADHKADCDSYTQCDEAVLYFYVDEVSLVDVRLVAEMT